MKQSDRVLIPLTKDEVFIISSILCYLANRGVFDDDDDATMLTCKFVDVFLGFCCDD